MHWKAVQKFVRTEINAFGKAVRADEVRCGLPNCSQEDVDKALARLVASGEVTLTRGWYRLAKRG
jgi:hypothetical protein